MAQTVLRYGKASQQRIGPYIVISKRKLPKPTLLSASSHSSVKPLPEIVKNLIHWLSFSLNRFLLAKSTKALTFGES